MRTAQSSTNNAHILDASLMLHEDEGHGDGGLASIEEVRTSPIFLFISNS